MTFNRDKSLAALGGVCPPVVVSSIDDYREVIVEQADSIQTKIEHWSEINTSSGYNIRITDASLDAIEAAISNLRDVLENVKIESRRSKPAALIGSARSDAAFQSFMQRTLAKPRREGGSHA